MFNFKTTTKRMEHCAIQQQYQVRKKREMGKDVRKEGTVTCVTHKNVKFVQSLDSALPTFTMYSSILSYKTCKFNQ